MKSRILDTEGSTRAKVEKVPYSDQKLGREALKLWIEPFGRLFGQIETSPGV